MYAAVSIFSLFADVFAGVFHLRATTLTYEIQVFQYNYYFSTVACLLILYLFLFAKENSSGEK